MSMSAKCKRFEKGMNKNNSKRDKERSPGSESFLESRRRLSKKSKKMRIKEG